MPERRSKRAGPPPGKQERRSGDRRETARVPHEIGIRLPNKRHYLTIDGNVSLGGVYLDTAVPLERGMKVELYIPLPDDGYDLALAGEVVRAPIEKSAGLRIKFTDLDFEAERLLARFIDAHLDKDE